MLSNVFLTTKFIHIIEINNYISESIFDSEKKTKFLQKHIS